MASSEGFEPPTVRLEGACSIQLSYEDSAIIITNSKNYFNGDKEWKKKDISLQDGTWMKS